MLSTILFSKTYNYCVLFVVLCMVLSCSDNEEQQNFEQEAFNSVVENFTETSPDGDIINEDPDDWRISPFFSGLIRVEPAYPNPVLSSGRITIQIQVSAIESMNGAQILTFDEQENLKTIALDTRIPLPTGFTEFRIDPIEFTNTGVRANAKGLHRIFIFDLNDNFLTYGDIKVE